jgi:hypothetical protein
LAEAYPDERTSDMEFDAVKDVIESIQLTAAEYRYRHRMGSEEPLEVLVHHDMCERLAAFYGSLAKAAQHIFDGNIVIVDRMAREITNNVNVRFLLSPPHVAELVRADHDLD